MSILRRLCCDVGVGPVCRDEDGLESPAGCTFGVFSRLYLLSLCPRGSWRPGPNAHDFLRPHLTSLTLTGFCSTTPTSQFLFALGIPQDRTGCQGEPHPFSWESQNKIGAPFPDSHETPVSRLPVKHCLPYCSGCSQEPWLRSYLPSKRGFPC